MERSRLELTTDAASALERAVPMLVRWFTRGEVKRSMLADVEPSLSWTDAWLLGRIADTGPVRLSSLAAWQEVDRSTMTTEVRRLEKLGLVDRDHRPGGWSGGPSARHEGGHRPAPADEVHGTVGLRVPAPGLVAGGSRGCGTGRSANSTSTLEPR